MKHNRKYKIKQLLILAAAMSLLLSGCASKDSNNETTASSDSTSTDSEISTTVKEIHMDEILDNASLMRQSFMDLYQKGKLVWDNDSITVDDQQPEGILICGDNQELVNTRFLLDDDFDFGSETLQRIMVTGLGQQGAYSKVCIYLDGAEEPAAVLPLQSQETEDSWEQEILNSNAIVTDQNITGVHKVEFTVCQYTAEGEPKVNDDTEFLLSDFQFVAETVPLVNITIDESLGTIDAMNNDTYHNTKCYGEMEILTTGSDTGCNSASYNGGTYSIDYIRGRGNSTWTPGFKVPYKIKLETAEDLFGMGTNQHWVLIANVMDSDLIRNAFTYKIGEELGMEYNPCFTNVDVVMNGRYLGNYLLCENIRVGKNRVELDNLEDGVETENLSGGYLLGTNSYGADADQYIFRTSRMTEFNVTSPTASDDPDYQEEMEYIENYMQRVENALYGEPDPVTGQIEDPFEFMDLDSAVAYYWVQELSTNGDFYGTASTYCYKKKDGKLYWGPLWDFDIAWNEFFLTSEQWVNRKSWFMAMLSNETFLSAAETYYQDVLQPLLDQMLAEDGFCNTYARNIEYAVINNYAEWGMLTQEAEFVNDLSEIRELYESSHEDFMINVRHRVDWCYENLDSLKTQPFKLMFQVEGKTIQEQTEYVNSPVFCSPEDPTVENKRFHGWYYQITDEEGATVVDQFIEGSTIPGSFLTETDGEYSFVVYAVFEEVDETKHPSEISFLQPEYHLYIQEEEETVSARIPFFTQPYDGYLDEIEWTVADPELLELEVEEHLLVVTPKAEGSTQIIGTVKDGNSFSLDIQITLLNEWDSAKDYAATDFRLSYDTLELEAGEVEKLQIEVLEPEEYLDVFPEGNDEYDWYVTNSDVCTVEYGLVIAENPGTTMVVCRNVVADTVRVCMVTVK